VQLLVGFDAEGKIHNTAVLSIKETPGLGSNMTNPKFKDQVNGKNPAEFKLSVKKDGGDVDAITAATISSRAFLDAVGKAVEAYKKGSK
jgi:Predicted NADH:ubiquinone oxidoreductase, subunit RnfG